MVYLLVKHKIKDYNKFKKAFHNNLNVVQDNGSQGGYIMRNRDDKNEVFVLLRWKDMDSFKKFSESKDPNLKSPEESTVSNVEAWFFDDVEEF
ncbi:MAG: antibiotic biosynthesis monooxygenase [Nanoarchaeota archaeon]